MTSKKMYRYIGRNGIITTGILLDGIPNIPMIALEAAPERILTDGEKYNYTVLVEESEASNWKEVEIPDNINKLRV